MVDYLCGSANHDAHDAMRPRMRLQIKMYFKTKYCFALQVLQLLHVYIYIPAQLNASADIYMYDIYESHNRTIYS